MLSLPNFPNFVQKGRDLFSDQARLKRWLMQGGLLVVVFGCLYVVGSFMPEGFDWKYVFSQGVFPYFWMPWTKPLVGWLTLPAVFALSVIGMGLRAYRYKPSPLPLVLALISLPTLWVFFLGNYDGLVLIGLLLLPLGVPLVLIKPQVAAFALLANRRWFIAGIVWGVLSLIIWGLWPLNLNLFFQPSWRVDWPQDISLFPWGLLLALPLLWFSRGDEDMLMAAGSLGTPHLFPYHFIVLMPALARLSWPWMWLTWLASWTPLLANWLGPRAWHFGNLVSLFLWIGLYRSKRAQLAREAELAQADSLNPAPV
jgi:hypothetical protein